MSAETVEQRDWTHARCNIFEFAGYARKVLPWRTIICRQHPVPPFTQLATILNDSCKSTPRSVQANRGICMSKHRIASQKCRRTELRRFDMASSFKKFASKAALGSALVATALVGATPAMADSYRGSRHHDDGAGTAIAVGLGILGIAAVAAIASNHDRDRDRDYNGTYYYDNGGYNNGGYYNGGGYYDQNRNWHRRDRDRRGYEGRGYEGRGYDGRGYYDRSQNHGYRGY